MSLWLIALAIPLFTGDWSWLCRARNTLVFGMQNWDAWAFEALMLNVVLFTLFSVFSKIDEGTLSSAWSTISTSRLRSSSARVL